MTDNQFKQMMDKMTKAVSGVQRIEKEIVVIKLDIVELKEGQARLEEGQKRLEKEMRATNRAFNELAGESLRVKTRVDELERRDFSN